MIRTISTAVGISILAWSMLASAALVGVQAEVTQTLLDSRYYGGCIARVKADFAPLGLSSCSNRWVSFSCTGDFNTPEMGFHKFEAAQLALATDTEIYVLVDDSRKHNGVCFAVRIDNVR